MGVRCVSSSLKEMVFQTPQDNYLSATKNSGGRNRCIRNTSCYNPITNQRRWQKMCKSVKYVTYYSYQSGKNLTQVGYIRGAFQSNWVI